MTRPILLAMNNPISADPRHALFPAPRGCSGWRLWQMCHNSWGCTRTQYLESFDRRNVLLSGTWDRSAALERRGELLDQLSDRVVVVLGHQVREALGWTHVDWLLPQTTGPALSWRLVPHPSGRCHWYNDPMVRHLVGRMLGDLVDA